MSNKAALDRALKFKQLYEEACREMEKVEWWQLKRVKLIRNKARWASYHYSKNMKIYKKSIKKN